MNREKLKAQLIIDEDKIPHAYEDSKGFLTIGVGHLIDKRKGGGLSNNAIDYILNEDIDKKYAGLIDSLPWVKTLDDARQNVLMNLAFNMGVGGLLKFVKTLEFVKQGNYKAAASEMLRSTWSKQVGDRAKRLSKTMETGVLP